MIVVFFTKGTLKIVMYGKEYVVMDMMTPLIHIHGLPLCYRLSQESNARSVICFDRCADSLGDCVTIACGTIGNSRDDNATSTVIVSTLSTCGAIANIRCVRETQTNASNSVAIASSTIADSNRRNCDGIAIACCSVASSYPSSNGIAIASITSSNTRCNIGSADTSDSIAIATCTIADSYRWNSNGIAIGLACINISNSIAIACCSINNLIVEWSRG